MAPGIAARIAITDYHALRPLADSTLKQNETTLRRILTDLAEKGLDLASITPDTLVAYRAYLQELVNQGTIDEDYAYLLVKDWNALQSLLFGAKDDRPGQGLKMKGFRQRPRVVDHLSMADIEAMISVLPQRHWMGELNREAVHTYLELAIASAGRWSSIGADECTFGDIDWNEKVIRFRVVKNKPRHAAVLTDRAIARLRAWRSILMESHHWKGDATPLLTGQRGTLTYQTVNKSLKDLAELAGIKKNVTTHVTRKSVATHIAKQNPRLAREQLGITEKIFQTHYNQPSLADRIERRDLLMGSASNSRSDEERIGALYLQLRSGAISQQEFDREVNRALLGRASRTPKREHDDAYG